VAVVILSVLYVYTLYNIPILAVGIRHLRWSGKKGKKAASLSRERLPTVSIVVPVRDEERVVGRLLKALLSLDYPPEKREIVIVEDGSMDKTAEICRKYAGQCPDQIKLIHQSTSNGKPSALNYALKHLAGEIVAVFDADSVPEPDVLMRAAEYFEDGSIAAVQGRTCSINADENMLTKFVSYEEAVRYETYLRGKDVLELFVPITGSCYFIRRSVLEEVGGWGDEFLSEDTELSAKLVERRYVVKYVPEVVSWQENPASLGQLFSQRTRWFRGCMEVGLKYGRLVRKLDRWSIDAEVTLAGPYMLALCFMGYLAALNSVLVPIQLDPLFTMMTQAMSLLSIISLGIIGIALVYATKPRKIGNLLWLPFIYAYWSLQTFLASYALIQMIFKRPRKWMKTTKTGVATNHARQGS